MDCQPFHIFVFLISFFFFAQLYELYSKKLLHIYTASIIRIADFPAENLLYVICVKN